jgi:hypothetical protein
MSLLERLQNALNKIYAGNTITGNIDEGVSHKDQYKCDCVNIVPEEEWIDELKMCKECYTEHYGDMPGHDEAEYKIGDR